MMEEESIQPERNVAVFCSFQGLGQPVLKGLANFFDEHKGLKFDAHCLSEISATEDFDESPYDAAILVDTGQSIPDSLQRLFLPVVRVFDRPAESRQALVGVDHAEVGRLAAQHLQGRGFKHFAFVGSTDAAFARVRYEAFRNDLGEEGLSFHHFGEPFPSRDQAGQRAVQLSTFRERMKAWLRALPKPIGVCALDDWKGFETQMLCRQLGIVIPEEVALIGVNDDDLACQISHPNLSSIRLPFERLGYEAGVSVLELLDHGKVADKTLPCIGLVTRASSNTFAVNDSLVAAALKFIQRESHRPIRVEEVLKHVGVSRSLLERRFRSEIGRTPLVEMRRQRVERARELLSDTDLAIHKIAELTGFASNIRFTTVFREQVGLTPTEFRSQMRNLVQSGAPG